MDCAENPLSQLSAYDGELPIIATNRGKWFGGKADDSGRLDHLFDATRFEAVEMVDIELETARGKKWIINEFRENNVELIISFHEFEETPKQTVLNAIIEDCAKYGDIAKVAAFAENQTDTLQMLGAINQATRKGINVAGISMGEIGSHTRVIGPLYGSKLGYAPLKSDTSEYAPGQISLHELKSLIEKVEEGGKDVNAITELEGNSAIPQFSQTD
ncbi:type I 3-dehydroquinate dehydratase [Halorussus rarus]